VTVKFGKGASRRRAESFRRLERLTRSFSFVSNSGGMARMLSGDLLGTTIEAVYHTGIVVYGKEYWFGHGLQCAPATLTQTQFGAPMRVEKLGETEVDEETWESFMREVAPRFTPETYNLLEHNCNNFSNEAAEFLVGRGIPQKILDLPKVVLETELGRALRPMLGMFEQRMRNTEGTSIGGDEPAAATAAAVPVAPEPKVAGLGLELPSKKKKVSKSATTKSPTGSSLTTGGSAASSSEDIAHMVRSLSQTFGELRESGASTQQATARVMAAALDELKSPSTKLENEP